MAVKQAYSKYCMTKDPSTLNLMENGRLTKTTKSESYEMELDALVFATANNKEGILEPLLDRFETYFLTEYTNDEFKEIAPAIETRGDKRWNYCLTILQIQC